MVKIMIKTYHIITFGCQANISDSEQIAGILEIFGFKNTKDKNHASLLIYNTCSVRQTAEDRVFGLNKKIRELKNKNPKLKILLTGCMTHYSEKELKNRLPQIDVFLPVKNKKDWFNEFKNFLKTNFSVNKVFQTSDQNKASRKVTKKNSYDSLVSIPKRESKFRALIPVSYGCNNFCSYCIVPYAKGREVSRDAEEILNEVKNLVKNNYKEIWLLGQNVNSYRCNFQFLNSDSSGHLPRGDNFQKNTKLQILDSKQKNINFADLLKMLNGIYGNFWIRFTSPHPKNFSDDLIKTMAKCEKFPHYLNLPVQSGDNEILKKMKRNYTSEEYVKLVRKIRKALPDIALSTDVITGFPGETKKQFKNTVRIFKKVKFDMAYISEYSERSGTLAAKKFKDDVLKKEKKERKKYLTETLAKTALARNKNLVGKILTVLIDKQKNNYLFGRTEGNKVVEIISPTYWAVAPPPAPSFKIGEFAKVKIISATAWKLKAEII